MLVAVTNYLIMYIQFNSIEPRDGFTGGSTLVTPSPNPANSHTEPEQTTNYPSIRKLI